MADDINLPATRRNELVEFLHQVKDMEPAKLQATLDLWERMQRLQAEAVFNDSLAAARRKIRRVERDKSNPIHKNRYASYSAMMDACEDALNEEDVLVRFGSEGTGDPSLIRISAILSKGMHTEKHSLDMRVSTEGPRGGRPALTDAQALGSAMTYGRKYLVQYVLNLIPDDATDDDGNSAGTVSPDDVKRLLEAFAAIGVVREQVERRIQPQTLDTMRPPQLAELRRIYVSLRSEQSRAEDWFSAAPPAKGNAGLRERLRPETNRAPPETDGELLEEGKNTRAPPGKNDEQTTRGEFEEDGESLAADAGGEPDLPTSGETAELPEPQAVGWPKYCEQLSARIPTLGVKDLRQLRKKVENMAMKNEAPGLYAKVLGEMVEREGYLSLPRQRSKTTG